MNGELPSAKAARAVRRTRSRRHTMINESLLRFYQRLPPQRAPDGDGRPPSSRRWRPSTTTRWTSHNAAHREIFAHRIIAKLPTIAAAAYKHSLGQPFVYPRNDLDYCANMLHMFFAVPCEDYEVDSAARRRRSTCCSSCTRTTSRTPAPRRCGSPAARAATRTPRSRPACPRSGARRTAARTRPCSTCSRRSATSSHIAEVPRARQGQERRRAAHGLRPPRLQELRPAREDHPRDVPQGARASSARTTTRCSSSRCGSRRSRSRTSTSSAASSTRTSTSTPASSTARSASRARCSR